MVLGTDSIRLTFLYISLYIGFLLNVSCVHVESNVCQLTKS